MRLIQENSKIEGAYSYQVAYRFNNNIAKIVKVHRYKSFGGITTHLQIQKIGLEASIEELTLLNGLPLTYKSQSLDESHRISSLDKKPRISQDYLERFGKEFKQIFDDNIDLQVRLKESFSSLIPYLK